MLNRCHFIKGYKVVGPLFVVVILWKVTSWLLGYLLGSHALGREQVFLRVNAAIEFVMLQDRPEKAARLIVQATGRPWGKGACRHF